MQINCELPLEMLEDNGNLNDYDFILYHLCDKYTSYKDYFKNNQGRLSILDNSAYEFFINKEEFREEDFISTIETINPTYYIVPDVLMDKNRTIENYKRWKHRLVINNSKAMLIPQGRSLWEWLQCYELFLGSGVEIIGIPFHNEFFRDLGIIFYEENKDLLSKFFPYIQDVFYALGRYTLLNYLEKHNLIEYNIHYHLLGSHWVWEKSLYKNFTFIKTFDTGFPVKCAIEGHFLEEPLFKKPHIIIDEFFTKKLNSFERNLIKKNINYFKNL